MRKTFVFFLVIILMFIIFIPETCLKRVVFCESEQLPESVSIISAYYKNGPLSSLDSFRQLLKIDMDNTKTKLNLIQLLRETGQYDEAITQLKSLMEQDPQNLNYRLNLIQTTYLAGRFLETIQISNSTDLSAEETFWRGLAFIEAGRDEEAVKTLTYSLAKEPFNPMANFKLGQLYQKTGDYEKAAEFYKKAAAQEPNLRTLYFPLAKVYIASGKYSTAYNLLLNAKAAYPWNQDINDTLQKLIKEHSEIFKQQASEMEKKRRIATVPQVIPIIDGRDKIPEIRIGLAEKICKFFIKTGDNFRLVNGDQNFQGTSGMVLLIQQSAKQLQILDEQKKILISGDRYVKLMYDNPASATVLFDVEYGKGTFWSGREDRIYRGSFDFLNRDEGITIVNRLNLEEYLYGVVPSEMEPNWPQAALEAQAVAARTYAISNLKAYDVRGFDLLATVASQVYSGVLVEKTSTNTAVNTTRGQILTYNNKPISAFYTANNGGYSASSFDIWGTNIPYLQAVPDRLLDYSPDPMGPVDLANWLMSRPPSYSSNPKYSGRSQYRWNLWVSREEIENRLKLGKKLGKIATVSVARRGIGGAVSQVLIKGTSGVYTITGDAIRSKLGGLRSNLFIIQPKLGSDGQPEYFIFYGGGWGHGVGMCQSGAAGMAADGFRYQEILTHYYRGTSITRAY